MIIAVQILLALAAGLIFLVGPPWLLGFFLCRMSAVWTAQNKIKKYYVIQNPVLARLLIPRYIGFNTRIRTNIPLLYNRYYVNQYPKRLSRLGAVHYGVTLVLFGVYAPAIIGYFLLAEWSTQLIPVCILLFMAEAVVFTVLINWNNGGWTGLPVITKEERRRRDGKQ